MRGHHRDPFSFEVVLEANRAPRGVRPADDDDPILDLVSLHEGTRGLGGNARPPRPLPLFIALHYR